MVTRISAGHPEGYLEAFATLYREAAEMIATPAGGLHKGTTIGVEQGLDGVRFVDACQRSSNAHSVWFTL